MIVEEHCPARKDKRMARHLEGVTPACAILFNTTHLTEEKEKLFPLSRRIHRWRVRHKNMSRANRPSKETWQDFRLNANYYYTMIG
jgi:hypothetical protein